MQDDLDIRKTVNEIGEEVEQVLESRNKEKYFEEIILLYSLIENLLKWSVFVKIFREKIDERELSKEELITLSDFCRKLTFYNALNVSLSVKLTDFNLYKKIDKVRNERNDVIHQLWIYNRRRNPLVLKKTLEMLAGVAKQLARITSRLTDEIGVEEIYKIGLLR